MRRILAAALAVVLLTAAPVAANPNQQSAISALEARVTALEARVAALEADPVPTSTPPPTPTPTVAPTPVPTPSPSAVSCSNLQGQIDATPTGGTLDVRGCTFHESVSISRAITVLGGTVTGDGVRQYAVEVTGSDVILDGMTARDTTNGAQTGVVNVRNVVRFTFRNGHITGSTAGACISVDGGTRVSILDSELDNCGQQGFHLPNITDLVFARNRIHDNNLGRMYDPGWEAGGGKAVLIRGALFEGNESWNNYGPGLWCDVDCEDVTYRNNRVHHNDRIGIFYETSSGGLIEGNAVWENGWGDSWWISGAGIVVSSSQNTEVRGNTVAWNGDGIAAIQQNRPDAQSAGNVWVHDNTIVLGDRTQVGDRVALGFTADNVALLTSTTRGSGNDYWSAGPEPENCRFQYSPNCYSTLSAFNGSAGEEGGVYLTIAQRDAALLAAGIPLAQELP